MYPTAQPETGPVDTPVQATAAEAQHVPASDSQEERIASELTDVVRDWVDDTKR